MPSTFPYVKLQRTLGVFAPLGGKSPKLGGATNPLLGDTNIGEDGTVRIAEPEAATVVDVIDSSRSAVAPEPVNIGGDGGGAAPGDGGDGGDGDGGDGSGDGDGGSAGDGDGGV